MKKILLLLSVALSLSVSAQNAVGDWMIHTSFVGNDVKSVVEAQNWVYYLSGGNLFRLDGSTQENEALSIINDLSDMGISRTYYNCDNDYLVVVYNNSNIDIIESNGNVVNMPEVKDAVLTTSKSINDVTFAPGLMYLATDFGYVVVDDDKFVVKESHIYGEAFSSVAQMGDVLLLSTADAFYYGRADEFHDQLSSFETTRLHNNCRFRVINDSTFFCLTGWTYHVIMSMDEDDNVSYKEYTMLEAPTTDLQATDNGYLLNVPSLGKCFLSDENGDNLEPFDTEGELCSSRPGGDKTIWAAGPNGLHELNSDTYYLPNALSFGTPFWMTYNQSSDKLYVCSTAANGIVRVTSPSAVNVYDGVKWENVTPPGAPTTGSYWIDFLPDDPSTYLLGTWRSGLLKVVNNEIVLTYDTKNSPIAQNWSMHPITTIDRNGNVWVVQSYENPDHPVMVLPAAKVKQNQVTAEDWIMPSIAGLNTGHTQRGVILSTRRSNYDIKLFSDGDFEMPLVIWNSANEISTNPQQVVYNRLSDQDGESVSWTNIICLTEDLIGNVWMGTSEGICMFNPSQAFAPNFSVIRPKVPRNDGTGLADRLMDGIQVNGIAVDGANRKWIATQSSGLFLVSADGTQIINKFNSSNSPLATNTVYKVCCNPNSNSVYITTPSGLYEYFSDSSPAEPDYSNIYAYPNPVRPENGGNVTIVGLMDNSLVKIADASGNVLAQLKSTGGMVTWDCCDQFGHEVKSGVYMVLCSRANGNSEAVVTKIAVIK